MAPKRPAFSNNAILKFENNFNFLSTGAGAAVAVAVFCIEVAQAVICFVFLV